MGGGGDLKTLWQRYYQDAHAVFFVIDSSDQKRVQQASEAFGNRKGMKKFLITLC